MNFSLEIIHAKENVGEKAHLCPGANLLEEEIAMLKSAKYRPL